MMVVINTDLKVNPLACCRFAGEQGGNLLLLLSFRLCELEDRTLRGRITVPLTFQLISMLHRH